VAEGQICPTSNTLGLATEPGRRRPVSQFGPNEICPALARLELATESARRADWNLQQRARRPGLRSEGSGIPASLDLWCEYENKARRRDFGNLL
jgi:hypothetical protein